MADPSVFDALLDYVGFDGADAAALRQLEPTVSPGFEGIIDTFYAAIAARPRARAVFTGGDAQIARQKARLREWLRELFGGVYDHAYFERRARIGRVHVQIELPQHFMFSAMNIIRQGLHAAIHQGALDAELRARGHVAVDRICDIELAIMLETYRERFVEQQRAQERLATLGQLAASVGHELRNPLAVMSTSVHLLRRRVDDPKAERHLDKIERQVSLAGRIVTDLLSMVRDRPPQRVPVGLAPLIEEVLEGLPQRRAATVDIQVDDSLPDIFVDRLQIRQVVANLLSNALEAMRGVPEGTVEIEATRDGDALVLEVRDDGPGFEEALLRRAFEPLTTTRETGVGLGLALCLRIVEGHGGEVFAENRAGAGARVGCRLPGAFAEQTPPAGAPSDESPSEERP